MNTVDILGYDTSAAGLAGDIRAAVDMLNSGVSGRYVACLNPHSLVEARTDRAFHTALAEADILLPDGVGIVIAARLLGRELHERVAGSDFFSALSAQAQSADGLRYFFMGSTETVLEKIEARLRREYPKITVCGTLSPPFKDELDDAESEAIIRRINAAKPDVLWVGMTAPKQEKWINRYRNRLDVPLIGAIGAVFDFYAGTKKRAPEWVCRLGLEWLPRLVREPRRLFRRNFVSTPLFLMLVAHEKLRKRAS